MEMEENKPQESNKFGNFKKRLGLPLIVILAVCSLLAFAGALGMIIYGVFIEIGGPIWVRNQYIGLWLMSMIFFFSLQAIYLILKKPKNIKNNFFYVEIVYFSLCILLSIVLTVCYGLAKKADATIWSLVLVAVNSLSIVILVIRRRENSMPVKVSPTTSSTLESSSNGSKKCQSCAISTLQIINIILKALFLIILGFLTVGSVIIGGLTVKYPPRGTFTTVGLADDSGRKLKLHYLCDGPVNNSLPIFIFEGDGSHGYMDYFGLQTLLKAKNRRSCIWDKAGLGYSDYMFIDMYDESLYYHNLVTSIGEKGPFIFVGWGGGGPSVYKYALQHPEMVHSLTFLDVSPARVEWTLPKILKNLTDEEYDKTVKTDMAGRYSLFSIINGLGVPWGLMSFFVPKGKVYPPETADEVNWYFLTDKTWTTQRQFLKNLPDAVDPYNKTLNASITVNHLISVKNDQQIIDQICKARKWDTNSTDCQYEIKANRLSIEWRRKLYNFNNVVDCTFDECNLGYFVFEGANYTVNTLMDLYKNDIIH